MVGVVLSRKAAVKRLSFVQCIRAGIKKLENHGVNLLSVTQPCGQMGFCTVGNVLDFLKKVLGGVHAVGVDVPVLLVVGDAVSVKNA